MCAAITARLRPAFLQLAMTHFCNAAQLRVTQRHMLHACRRFQWRAVPALHPRSHSTAGAGVFWGQLCADGWRYWRGKETGFQQVANIVNRGSVCSELQAIKLGKTLERDRPQQLRRWNA
ncbi:hypothetical protein XAC4134 [Xanthomonas citri pv. citri str. 306]|uniref:Uncharacterized protein n=1 Tax=Xanthomonas axonopodis pv. citri (strain 306) TaxID=190486 RepID=A0AAI8EU73_XANAC|nr:hypothetical protein XAC4134 [Xanthomonas citri pv. citri str. 306]